MHILENIRVLFKLIPGPIKSAIQAVFCWGQDFTSDVGQPSVPRVYSRFKIRVSEKT